MYNTKKIKDKTKKGAQKKTQHPLTLNKCELQVLYITESEITINYDKLWDSLVAQTVKRLHAMQETWVRSLGWEDPLEKEMATHSRIFLPRKFHGWRSLVGYRPWGRKELDTTERLHFSLHYYKLQTYILI